MASSAVYGNHAGGTISNTKTADVTINGKAKSSVWGNDAVGNIDGSSATVLVGSTGAVTTDLYGNRSGSSISNVTTADVTINGSVGSNVWGNNAVTNIADSSATVLVGSTGAVTLDVYGNHAGGAISNTASADMTINGMAKRSVWGNDAVGNITGSSATVLVGSTGAVTTDLYGNRSGAAISNTTSADVTINGLVGNNVWGNNAVTNIAGSSATVLVGSTGAVTTDLYGSYAGGTISNTTASVTVNGKVNGNVYGNSQASGDANGASTISIGATGQVKGSIYANGDSTSTATITVNGTIGNTVNGGQGNDTVTINGLVGRITPGTSSLFGGNDTVTVNNLVTGNIVLGEGSDMITVDVNTLGEVTGMMSGNNSFTPDDYTVAAGTNPGDLDILDLGDLGIGLTEAEAQTIQAALSDPGSGTLTFRGKTYTWRNFTELRYVLTFIKASLAVTWFDPKDGRIDGKAADRIATYCDFDKGMIGVLLVNNLSQGESGSLGGMNFKVAELIAAGSTGIAIPLDDLGIVSIMSADGVHFYAAWNGGKYQATGQGDFSKSFSCQFSA